jgi:hypothetical protein
MRTTERHPMMKRDNQKKRKKTVMKMVMKAWRILLRRLKRTEMGQSKWLKGKRGNLKRVRKKARRPRTTHAYLCTFRARIMT